jgi:serine/threonine protein kinase
VTLPLRQLEGKYDILHKIKEGGMGAIYKVRHLLLEETRVIKVIRPQFAEDDNLQRRFLREAKTAIRLRHANIAQLYDFAVDKEDGTSYIVMEYIDGVTLQELVRKSGPPPLGLALDIADQSLHGLSYLHHQGYIHRDISPDNLMLTRDFRGGPLVKLIDLGIAKPVGSDVDLTQTGMFMGKVRYAPPEQFSGTAGGGPEQDHRSDVYSFGVLLYELLTGKCPIVGENFSELIAGHLFRPPLDFAESDPKGRLSNELREVLLRALAKSPDDRFEDADQFSAALRSFKEANPVNHDDLDRVLRQTMMLIEETGQHEAPGSTQSRLNRQFAPATTPNPTAPIERLAELKASPFGAGQDKIDELFANAELLLRLEQSEKAEHELNQVLALAPEHSEARSLLAAVQEARAEARKADRRRQARAASAQQARELLAAGQAKEAAAVLTAAVTEHGASKELHALREEAEGVLRIQARERTAAAASVAATEPEAARAAAIASAEATIATAIAADELDLAERELEAALAAYGEVPSLLGLQSRLEQKRALLERQAAAREPQSSPQPLPSLSPTPARGGAAPAEDLELSRPDDGAPPRDLELDLGRDAPPRAPGEQAGEAGLPSPRRRSAWKAVAAIAAVLALAAIGWWVMGHRSAGSGEAVTPGLVADTGTLVLNALPWGRVERIVDAAGTPMTLPQESHTPLRLALPAGTYKVEISNPRLPSPREVEVTIRLGETAEQTVSLLPTNADAYLERVLAPP